MTMPKARGTKYRIEYAGKISDDGIRKKEAKAGDGHATIITVGRGYACYVVAWPSPLYAAPYFSYASIFCILFLCFVALQFQHPLTFNFCFTCFSLPNACSSLSHAKLSNCSDNTCYVRRFICDIGCWPLGNRKKLMNFVTTGVYLTYASLGLVYDFISSSVDKLITAYILQC